MKIPFNTVRRIEQTAAISPFAATAWLAFTPLPAHAALTEISPAPLASSSTAVVLPNIMFILDNSGSMDRDYMPDYVTSNFCKDNSSTSGTLDNCQYGDPAYHANIFNGLAYSPNVTYKPAVDADTSSRTSYNSAALWAAVPNDAYGIQFTGSIDLTQNYPDIVWCSTGSPSSSDRTPPYLSGVCKHPLELGTNAWTTPNGTFSSRQNVNNGSAPFIRAPFYYNIASLQWCSNKDANGFGAAPCQSKKTSTYRYPAYGAATRTDIVANEVTTRFAVTTVTHTQCGEGLADNCCGNISGGTFRNVRERTLVQNRDIVTRGARVVSETTTTVSDNTVLRHATCQEDSTGLVDLPSPNPAVSSTSTQLSSVALSYPKAASRTDCTGPVGATGCSFTEEMTNFANWYAYYRTRMQAMKTGAGLAFKTLNQNYRVGFLTIQPLSSTSNDSPVLSSQFLANAPFEGAQRTTWYQQFYDTNPSSFTPLREALARAGRYYAGMGPGDTAASKGINRGMNHDPIQYSCQQNFAILSTDGLWNDNDETRGPVSINNTTLVGNPDSILASAPRPLYDGSNAETTTTTTTSTVTQAVCSGSAGVLGTSCGCPANLKRIKQQSVNNISTTVTKGGTSTTSNSSNTTYTNPYPADGSCDALRVGTETPQETVEIQFCKDGTTPSNRAVFQDGQTNSCSGCNWGRGWLVRQTNQRLNSSISYDGGAPIVTNTVTSTQYHYSTNGTTWNTSKPSGGSCTSSNLTPSPSGVAVNDTGPVVNVNTGSTVSAANFTIAGGGPVVTSNTSSSTVSGTSNTLADVAQYYYITDLRDGKDALGNTTGPATSPSTTPTAGGDVSENNVKGQPSTDVQNDSATWQHMTTFTLGLGVDGTLTYAPDYRTNPTGDFLLIRNGTADWPAPVQDGDTAVDDLWHAAVNGRGKYLSARDPSTLASGLSEALASVNAVVGAAAAAATSNLEPVAGDNFAYIASYETVRWNGEVEARTIDLNTGAVSSTNVWSAKSQLDTLTNGSSPGGANRKIWRRLAGATDAGTGSDLQDFLFDGLDATTEQIYFQPPHISGGATGFPALTQWAALDTTTQHPLAQGTNLVNFLRGDGAFEDNASVTALNRVFRDRVSVLGDVVNAQPVFVKKSALGYVDDGYAAFKSCLNDGGTAGSCLSITGTDTARPATVYIASNDGMLHAFNGDTGVERWAFVPNILLPKLYRLADSDYSTAANHQWLVDGSPVVGDIHDGTKWRTILVGGLNSGGRGYYALDITDPAKPKALWEFNVRPAASCPGASAAGDTNDCDLGFTYGNPIISKLGNGDWAVMFPSGFNNVNPGDGKGYLYVVNPLTGELIRKIQLANATQTIDPGDTTTPMGFSKINNWVDDTAVNNTTLRVYGGDLLGNVWRIDADNGTAYVIAQLTSPDAVGQPITTKPELGQVTGSSGTADMVYVATGKYLGAGDVATTQVQTIYGIKDSSNGTPPTPPVDGRGGTVVAQTLTDTTDATGAAVRTVTSNPVSVTSAGVDGWRVDLPVSGERVNVDMRLQLGTLIIGSNVPANNACNAGGFSFLNFLDYRTGSYIPSSGGNIAGQRVGNSLLVGINVVRLPNNKTVAIATTSDNQHPTLYPPFQSPNPVGRRVGWTELTP